MAAKICCQCRYTNCVCVHIHFCACMCMCVYAYFQQLSLQECSMALQKGILVLTAGPLSPLGFHLVSH